MLAPLFAIYFNDLDISVDGLVSKYVNTQKLVVMQTVKKAVYRYNGI